MWMRGCCAALLVVFGCSGAPRTIHLDEISLQGCPSEEEAGEPVHVEAVPEALRPEAVGLWKRWCDPENPGPHVPRAHEALVYDGAYVTLVALEREQFAPEPPLYITKGQGTYRLESRWVGDVLQVRIPASILRIDDEDADRPEYVDIGRLQGGRFVWPESDEPAYVRATRGLSLGPWSHLTEPHAPVTDYESEQDTRNHFVFARIADTIRPCAVSAQQRLASAEASVGGTVLVDLGPNGEVLDDSGFGSADPQLTECCMAALSALSFEGYSAPERGTYRFQFGIRNAPPDR